MRLVRRTPGYAGCVIGRLRREWLPPGVMWCAASSAILMVLGCRTAVKFADEHTFGPMLGPCRRAMDSVERTRGQPERKVVGDEEDVRTGHQLFEHEWGYLLDPGSRDSVEVVRFRWEEDTPGCRVDVRRARRLEGVLLPPWEEAPDESP